MPVIGKLESGELLVYEEVSGPANYQNILSCLYRGQRFGSTRR
jgi:hypothetical protein